MAILLLSTDLMFGSRVSGAAARIGLALQTFATPDSLLERLELSKPKGDDAGGLVVLDLTMRHFDPKAWVPRFRQAANPPKAIVAYGPHVQDAILAAAAGAGCDQVYTRGQFNARMDEILAGS
ncbi:MAG TPA: hypothetical protein VHX65_13455 [Pirellulales bacterium]|jgi:DNA-binding response OmpR family regulator|nr:hypothetical protein [Pirellulales bacterium]